VRYSTEASIGGKLGQIGGRLISASAKKIADDFFLAFAKELGGKLNIVSDAKLEDKLE
jgi:carbon monoxide dehydrogenase subunit G